MTAAKVATILYRRIGLCFIIIMLTITSFLDYNCAGVHLHLSGEAQAIEEAVAVLVVAIISGHRGTFYSFHTSSHHLCL